MRTQTIVNEQGLLSILELSTNMQCPVLAVGEITFTKGDKTYHFESTFIVIKR